MQYAIRHGQRTIEFDGKKLSSSTSHREGSSRWVDFSLYLTAGGSYVLERTGQTLVYHDLGCSVVERNKLKFRPEDVVGPEHVPCFECLPNVGDPNDIIVVEKPRHYALVSDAPEAIIDALHKRDESGARYMTKVTERLVEDAARTDKRLERAYRTEYIL